MYKMSDGVLVVLDGIDHSGKTTALHNLASLEWCEPRPLFTHQPSSGMWDTEEHTWTAGLGLCELIYSITEHNKDMNMLTRQLLHTAAHSEHYEKVIFPALEDRGVVMDRCWWSALAYSWYAGGLMDKLSLNMMVDLAQLPAIPPGKMVPFLPTVVYMFLNEFTPDDHNSEELVNGYRSIAKMFRNGVEVPVADEDETVSFIVNDMLERGICTYSEE